MMVLDTCCTEVRYKFSLLRFVLRERSLVGGLESFIDADESTMWVAVNISSNSWRMLKIVFTLRLPEQKEREPLNNSSNNNSINIHTFTRETS